MSMPHRRMLVTSSQMMDMKRLFSSDWSHLTEEPSCEDQLEEMAP